MSERQGLNDDPNQCMSAESAYFWHIEEEYLQIPDELSYDRLEADIPEVHQRRIKPVWKKVQEFQRKLRRNRRRLCRIWDNPPETTDQKAWGAVESTQIHIRKELKGTVASIISHAEEDTPLEDWQGDEEDARRGVSTASKNYVAALRLYYELLLEKPIEKTEKAYQHHPLPLPEDHPKRDQIMVRNRYLRVIDAVHEGISAAKAIHHTQQKGRLRKDERTPYVIHPVQATFNYLFDTLPYIIDERRLEHNPVLLVILLSIHDLAEDSDLDVSEIIKGYMESRADFIDSRLLPLIQSGFGLSRTEFRDKIFDLIGEENRDKLHDLLRMVSNNTELETHERNAVLQSNFAGTRTHVALREQRFGPEVESEPERILQRLGVPIPNQGLPKPSRTFSKHPPGKNPDKATCAIARHLAIKPKSSRLKQAFFMAKLQDVQHNLITLNSLNSHAQQRTLREAATRYIAWPMLDDHKQFGGEGRPLYNVLGRLIDTAIAEYQRFELEHGDLMDGTDRQIVLQLRRFQIQVNRNEVPDQVQAIANRWQAAAGDRNGHRVAATAS